MAKDMERIAARYKPKSKKPGAVPYAKDLRRGINIAACDAQPLVVVLSKSTSAQRKAEQVLEPLVVDPRYAGRFCYATTKGGKEAKGLEKLSARSLVAVVAPGTYGLEAEVLAQTSATDKASIERMLDKALKAFKAPHKDQRQHVRTGRREGVYWETEIPVTDPGGPPPHERGGRRGR